MTEKDLYDQLQAFKDVIDKYKNKTLTAVTADEVETMRHIYSTVNTVYPNSLARIFSTGCGSCIISTLEKFISIYDRLKLLFEPEPVKKKENKEVKFDSNSKFKGIKKAE